MSLLDYLPKTKKQKIKKTIQAFDKFLDNTYSSELSPEQEKKNLEEGIIEIVYNDGEHASNGLLITEDGYFITNRHCASKLLSKKIKTYDGREYFIEKYGFQSTKKKFEQNDCIDLALLKAKIHSNCVPKNYSFLDSSQLKIIEPIILLTRLEGKIKINGGLGFRQESLGNENMLFINVNGKQGDSGGIISNGDGKIIGNFYAIIKNSNTGICINSNRMLDLVRFAKKSLESKI